MPAPRLTTRFHWLAILFFLMSVLGAGAVEAQQAPTMYVKFALSRRAIKPDGTKPASGAAWIATQGLPADASVYVDGAAMGAYRQFSVSSVRPGVKERHRVTCILKDQTRASRTFEITDREVVTLRLTTQPEKVVVVTRLDCIQQEGLVAADRPRLTTWSDRTDPRATEQNKFRTGETWPMRFETPTEARAVLRLEDIDLFDPIDHLGDVTVDVNAPARDGVFNKDPNGVGCLYRVFWRIEPDDTLREEVVKALGDKATRDAVVQRLKTDNDRGAAANTTLTTTRDGRLKARNEEIRNRDDWQGKFEAASKEHQRLSQNRQDEQPRYDRLSTAYDTASRTEKDRRGEMNDSFQKAGFQKVSPKDSLGDAMGLVSSSAPVFGFIKVGPISIPENKDEWDRSVDHAGKQVTDLADQVRKGNPAQVIQALKEKTFTEAELLADGIVDAVQKAAQATGSLLEKTAAAALKTWSDASKLLAKAQKEYRQVMGDFEALGKKIEEQANLKELADKTIEAAKTTVAVAEHAYSQAEQAVKEGIKEVETFARMLLDRDFVLFRVENEGTFSLNAYTGSIQAKLDLGLSGASWDLEKTIKLFEGQLQLPEIDPLQAVAGALGQKYKTTSGFVPARDQTKSPDPARRVYFATREFVDWGGPETAAWLVALTILGGGDQAAAEAKQKLVHEYDALYSWLSLCARDVSPDLLETLLARAFGETGPPLPNLTVTPLTVPYSYSADVLGLVPLPGPVLDFVKSRMGGLIAALPQPRADLQHLSYSVTMTSPNLSAEERHRDLLSRMDGLLFSGANSSQAMFSRVIQGLVKRLGGNSKIVANLASLSANDYAMNHANTLILQRIQKELGISRAEVERYYVPNENLLRLEGSPLADRFESFFGKIALGNRGRAYLQSLEFNLETLTFSGQYKVIHEHRLGSLADFGF